MRLQLLSDLHLERYPQFKAQAAPDVDVLILAGDIGSYQPGSRLETDDFGLGQFSPLRPGSPWRTVLYVPGNHEYDGLEFAPTHERLKAICAQLGIIWLEQAVHTIGAVRFVGTTLWSDFDAFAAEESNLTRQLQQREKAYRAANFYLRKNTTLLNGEPMLAEPMRELALRCQDWLQQALAEPFDGHTVVVTHFAPSLLSADPRYGLTPGTAGFCNGLDDLLRHAQLWVHGHLHCPVDYLKRGQHEGQAWQCRVAANPRGYVSKGEQETFVEQFVIDLDLRQHSDTATERGPS
ncbi:metallophosphoesterase [Aquabacterium sp.]|uniref:metallophosphoesterase n=1 Tax=Aquabacterium sp. TaxID=1872578 RepID=UPI00403783FB